MQRGKVEELQRGKGAKRHQFCTTNVELLCGPQSIRPSRIAQKETVQRRGTVLESPVRFLFSIRRYGQIARHFRSENLSLWLVVPAEHREAGLGSPFILLPSSFIISAQLSPSRRGVFRPNLRETNAAKNVCPKRRRAVPVKPSKVPPGQQLGKKCAYRVPRYQVSQIPQTYYP